MKHIKATIVSLQCSRKCLPQSEHDPPARDLEHATGSVATILSLAFDFDWRF